MARIIIAPAGGGTELEVEQVTFDEGFFHGYVYVRDASPTASSEPSAEETRVAGFVTGGTVLPAALRAAYVTAVVDSTGGVTLYQNGVEL